MRIRPALRVLVWSALGLGSGCGDDGVGSGETDPATSGVSAAAETSDATGDPTETGAEATVSYARDIRPIFAVRCTACHHDDSAIDVDIADPFSAPNGIVGSVNTWAEAYPEGGTPPLNIDPGNVEGSFILQKISDPDLDGAVAGSFMPLALPRLTTQELADLRAWIDAGANDDQTFADTIRPIFGDETRLGASGGKCTYCHHSFAGGTPPNLTDPFDPQTGAVGVASTLVPGMLRIAPGDAAASFLVQKVEATEPGPMGAPMPMHFAPLSAEEIDRVATWIAEGAQDN
jgi:hypothetical protein